MEIKTTNNLFIDVKGAVTYSQYINMLEKLVLKKQTSGPEQSEEKILATKINLQRMKRIAESVTPDVSLQQRIKNAAVPMIWLVISEAWCGDAAQNLPIIHKIAGLNNEQVKLQIVFRDENPYLMDQFLTNGSRSIPVLICLNADTHEVLTSWGPRPQVIQELLNNYKKLNPNATHHELMYHVHLNYFHDKGHSLQRELSKMMDECTRCYSRVKVLR